MYDLEVEDAHEFFANGILVHNSTQDGGCYTAGVLMARTLDGRRYYVEHVEHGQWEPYERNQKMKATAERDLARYPNDPPIIWVEREGGASGRDAFMEVARVLAGHVVKEQNVSGLGDKDKRAEPWSSQLAAGNVWLVDDGTWDVQGYVEEHCRFKPETGKRGRYKDRVDASSGAFSLLAGKHAARAQIRILGRGKLKSGALHVAVLGRDELGVTVVEERALFVWCSEPRCGILVGVNGGGGDLTGPSCGVGSNGDAQAPLGTPLPPPHACHQLIGSVSLTFADLDPADLQEHWNEVVEPYGRKPEELILSAQEAKKLWAVWGKHKDKPPQVIVFADEGGGDRRARSLAAAFCESLRLTKTALWAPGETDNKGEGEPNLNRHVVATVKAARALVL